jgi:hypothetical protein
MFTFAPNPPWYLLFVSISKISVDSWLSTASNIGVLPALSGISIA